MNKLFKLVAKDFKMLFRSKASSLVILFVPLLIIFLMGIAFDHNDTYAIKIGVFSSEYNDDVNSLISKLQTNEFSVYKKDTEEECLQEMKDGGVNTCIIFSENFNLQSNNAQSEVTYYVDYSKINLVYMISDTLSDTINVRNDEVSKSLTSNILDKLENTRNAISSQIIVSDEIKTTLGDDEAKLVSMKEKISTLDSSFDTGKVQTGVVEAKAVNIQSQQQELLDFIIVEVNASKKDIQDAKDDIQGSNSSSGANSELNAIDISLGLILDKAKSIASNLNSSSNEIISLIKEANVELSSVKSRFETITSTNNEVATELDSLVDSKKALTEKITSIIQVLESKEQELSTLTVSNADKIATPVKTHIKPISTKSKQLNFIFPLVIVLIIMFVSILLASTLTLMEKNSPAAFRNFISPVHKLLHLFAVFLTTLVVICFQLVVILGIGNYFFEIDIINNFGSLCLVITLISSIFILFGLLVGMLFNSEETGALGAVSLSTLFLFFSDLITPLESMSKHIFNIAQYNPFVISTNLVKKVLLFGTELSLLKYDLIILFSYLIVLFIIIYFFNSTYFRHLYHRIKSNRFRKNR